MGILIAKFRSKPSTIDVLEQIEKDITRLQKFRLHNQQQQKKFIGCLILYSIVLYIIAALVIYFVYFPPDWKNRLLYSSPLLIFPVLIWLIKKFLHWYFVKRITKNDLALNELRENRKQILEDVMEKETYKKAREILQKFDPARFKELEPSVTASPTVSSPGTTLRQRGNASGTRVSPQAPQRHPTMQLSTPGMRTQRSMTPQMRPGVTTGQRPGMSVSTPRGTDTPQMSRQGGLRPRMLMTPIHNGRTPGPPLPRPILPRERSTTDRLLEYLVGDGPQNRFALICRYCHSHNGMALKEEFEYLSFRCCYCYQMNLAKKQKPYAPKLDTVSPTTGVRPLQKPSGAGVSKPDDEESESESDEEESSDETSKEINGDDFVTTSQHNTETEEEIGQTKVKGEVTGQTGVGGQEIETITSSVDSTAEDVDGVYPLEEENGSDLENKGVPDGTKSDEIQEEGAVAQ
ncbi:endoplasmic reticulum junction formation protein lunapark-B-like isoform X1 [Ylistrum balloti]|uniref:endoplasmic reticulum junction formation protein lunapark-B-like isoform X1 n=1 Tax=Ylistrum balloti TaxID=509963 RepID=UPI0029059ADB|nr:endoplasmic reticulum junction formation protein lunapark-B-like isoform X1 [Ylistrum balloti]